MTTVVVLSLIEKYAMDKGNGLVLFLEVIIKVSKTASQLNGTSAQLKYNTWVKV